MRIIYSALQTAIGRLQQGGNLVLWGTRLQKKSEQKYLLWTIFFKFKQKCKFRIRTHNLDLCNHDHIKDCDCEYFNCPFIHAAHGEKINQRIDDPRIDWEAYNDPREED